MPSHLRDRCANLLIVALVVLFVAMLIWYQTRPLRPTTRSTFRMPPRLAKPGDTLAELPRTSPQPAV